MSIEKFSKDTMSPHSAEPVNLHRQCAALCYRVKGGKTQVLLITSRYTKRWVAPKGWIMPNKTAAQSAAQEAYEEAGVEGRLMSESLGDYKYLKVVRGGPDLPCVVAVFPILVKDLRSKFPEKNQRKRKWFPSKIAAKMVAEPDLAKIIRKFDPRQL